jgi:hypothetical protein
MVVTIERGYLLHLGSLCVKHGRTCVPPAAEVVLGRSAGAFHRSGGPGRRRAARESTNGGEWIDTLCFGVAPEDMGATALPDVTFFLWLRPSVCLFVIVYRCRADEFGFRNPPFKPGYLVSWTLPDHARSHRKHEHHRAWVSSA